MCGIAGFIGYDLDQADIGRALTALHHRGPDGRGVFEDSVGRVALGHARLSIIDLTTGAQPLYSEDGNIVLVCNGEIYGFESIRADLEARGHRFSTHSDSEVIIHLYEQHGLSFVDHLRGEFAFLLFDKREQKVFAVRDRFGIKPLFFHRAGQRFLFGSEAKALFAMGPLAPRIDVAAVRASFSFIPPDSIFEGVAVVPPGCILSVCIGSGLHQFIQYWDLDLKTQATQKELAVDDATMEVRAAVEEAITLRLRADVPVGVYLSGGIDSAIIAATSARHLAGRLKVFTVEFPEEARYNERSLAVDMAEKIGAEFHSVRCDRDALLENLEDSLWTTELPCVNLHGVGKFMLSALARKHVTVVLTGEGSDEIFLGYTIFRRASMSTAAVERIPPRKGTASRDLFDAIGYAPGKGMDLLFSRLTQALLRLFFTKSHRPSLRKTKPYATLLRHLKRPQLEGLSEIRKRQAMWIKCMLPQYLLTMLGDRSEMAHAIEGRTPFLDHKLFELTRRIPDHFKIRKGVEKYVLREAFKDDLTPDIYGRKKWPYTAPPLWIRKGDHSKLDQLIDEHLSKAAITDAGIFSWRTVRACRTVVESIPFNCVPRRVLNMCLLFILTTQVLHRVFIQDFSHSLERQSQRISPDAQLTSRERI